MFSLFWKTLPQVSIFHNPASPTSTRALALLEAALSAPYPPLPASSGLPLSFRLDVVRGTPPTAEQFHTIHGYLQRGSKSESVQTYSAFLTEPRLADACGRDGDVPQTAGALAQLAVRDPGILNWPIVVHWDGGMASVGDVEGVQRILETLRRQRDGEGPQE